MDDYIKRDAALESLCVGCEFVPIEEKENCPYRFTGCQEYANIFSLRAADVAPVRHGRWIVSRTDYGWNGAEFPTHCKCDQCGREVPYQDRDNYCPNCDARMDGDKE